MKVGDKLLCKKDAQLKSRYSYLHDADFFKDSWYEIQEILGKTFIIRGNNNSGPEISFYWSETLPNDSNYYHIWDYFYNPTEIRKMKLEKLMEDMAEHIERTYTYLPNDRNTLQYITNDLNNYIYSKLSNYWTSWKVICNEENNPPDNPENYINVDIYSEENKGMGIKMITTKIPRIRDIRKKKLEQIELKIKENNGRE